MSRLDPTEDTQYIVGRPFQTPAGWAWPGEPAPEEAVTSINLYALLSSGFLYAYVPDANYAYLPPHVYSAVRTYQEVNDIITKGEAPVEMEWTPPKKLQQAMDAKDAEDLSREASKVASPATAEDWTRKLEVNQISPRPVEIPREELFTDSMKGEAEAAADDGEDDNSDDRDKERREAAEQAFKDNEDHETKSFVASGDNPLRPEFEDSDLQGQFEEAQVKQHYDEIEIVDTQPDVLDRQDEFNSLEFEAPELSPSESKDYAAELKEEWEKGQEEQAEEAEPVADESLQPEPEADDEETSGEGEYGSFTKDELIAEAKSRDLPTSGTKAEIIDRLETDDASA